jgi:putative acetyltransferase
MFKVCEDDLSGDAALRLLALHLAGMHANSPPNSVYALDLSGLKAPGKRRRKHGLPDLGYEA